MTSPTTPVLLTCSTCPASGSDIRPWGNGVNKCGDCFERENKEATDRALETIQAAFPRFSWKLEPTGAIVTKANGVGVSLINSYSSWMLFTDIPGKKGMGEDPVVLLEKILGWTRAALPS